MRAVLMLVISWMILSPEIVTTAQAVHDHQPGPRGLIASTDPRLARLGLRVARAVIRAGAMILLTTFDACPNRPNGDPAHNANLG
jgi:hypothetical protein